MQRSIHVDATRSPFDPAQEDAYLGWKERKLAQSPARIEDLVVEVRDPRRLTPTECDAILDRCARANMAIYAGGAQGEDKRIPHLLGRQLGLLRLDQNPGADEDAISSLTPRSGGMQEGYIPYTDKAIAWHTDGYYNAPDSQIHGMLLHCVRPAAAGGENQLLDHEIAYMLVRDRDPEFIRALMHPQAMTVPAHRVEEKELRPERSGPVFSVTPTGHLHMRYTDRTRSLRWRDDPMTAAAVACLKSILHTDSPWHFAAKLEPGWGLVANNTLHTRTKFEAGTPPRLLYRARYYDRIRDR